MKRFLLLLCLVASFAHATPYAPPFAITWTPGVTVGVPGGIPTNRTNIINVTQAPYNADNTGATDVTSILVAAINAAAIDDIVYLPAGTYKTTNLTLPYTKDQLTIRGDGFGANGGPITRISANGYVGILGGTDAVFGFYGVGNSIISSGATAGSTSVTVVSGAGFTAGKMAQILVPNDPTIPTVNTYSATTFPFNTWITNVSGNTLTISPPLVDTFPSGCVIRTTISPSQKRIGIENLLVDGTASSGGMTFGIFFQGLAYACWISDVKVIGATNYSVFFLNSVLPEIRRSWIDGGGFGGTNHSGILFNTVTGHLVENNVILNSQPSIEFNYGTVGGVFGYNYADKDSFGLDLNHGPTNRFNLYEGNVAPRIISDGFFGGSYADTIFRNWIRGANTGMPINAVSLKRITRKPNLVGNIVQTLGLPYSDDGVHLGFPNIGNESFNGTASPSTGAWWFDYDTGTNQPKTWTGVLTARTTDTSGTVTLGTGQGTTFGTHLTLSLGHLAAMGWGSGGSSFIGTLTFAAPVGDVTTFTSAAGTLPVLGTSVTLYPGADGFQEMDLDVANTITRKANYYYFSHSIPAGESLGALTLPDSLYLSGKPTLWGPLTWPAFDPYTPTSVSNEIPAQYFYRTGNWPSQSGAAPVITLSPVSQNVATGANVTFTASASGDPAVTWQWNKNAVPIGGATSASLTLSSVTSANNGSYTATATNTNGSATTSAAILVVADATPATPGAPVIIGITP